MSATAADHLVEKQEDLENKAQINQPLIDEDRENHVFEISSATIFF